MLLVPTLLLLVPFAIALFNAFAFARIRRGEAPAGGGLVSVLVPARNEERSIEACTRSLLAQTGVEVEVIVLDDGSTDRTSRILAAIARQEPRLTVIGGAPLPPGWIGKNWACHQLAARSRGEWLLFTDADTRHDPRSAEATVAAAERLRVDLLSGVPRLELGSFWERVIVPMAPFLYWSFLPNPLIRTARSPSLAATNGQLLMIRRDLYDEIGGHAAVRAEIVEDLEIGRRAKRAGGRIALATAVETVSCRMYHSAGEIVEGFSKNLYPGIGANFPALVAFIIVMGLYLVPPVLLVAGMLAGGESTLAGFWFPLFWTMIGLATRGLMALRLRLGWSQWLLQPIGAAGAIVIGLISRRRHRHGGARWKGRQYDARSMTKSSS